MGESSYPTVKESVDAIAEMWVKWNIHELDAHEAMLELDRKGYFLDAITKAWAKECDLDEEVVKNAWLIDREKRKNLSSPTTMRDENGS